MANTCLCPVEGECFAKRGHGDRCTLLVEAAIHWKADGEYDCAFRKPFREKVKEWVPLTEKEKQWAESIRNPNNKIKKKLKGSMPL